MHFAPTCVLPPHCLCTASPCHLQWVLIKGGHLTEGSQAHQQQQEAWEGPPQVVTDVLFDGRSMLELTEPYIRWVAWRGWRGVGGVVWVGGWWWSGFLPCLLPPPCGSLCAIDG